MSNKDAIRPREISSTDVNPEVKPVDRYFEACFYANQVLGDSAPRRFSKLRQLARDHDLVYLRSSIDSWNPQIQSAPLPAVDWTPGMQWGDLTLVKHIGGIIWDCRCSCGKMVKKVSCNYTTPDHLRKCDTCQLADSLKEGQQAIVRGLTEIAERVLELHRKHDKLIWHKIRKAFKLYSMPYDETLAKDLQAATWARVTEKLAGYQDQGFKITTWLGSVCDGVTRDHLRQHNNRQRLVPITSLTALDNNGDKVEDPNAPQPIHQSKPAKSTAPKGSGPDTPLTRDQFSTERFAFSENKV